MSYYKIQENCRICYSSQLVCFLDLGNTELADRFISKNDPRGQVLTFPLAINTCIDCGWLQLTVTVNPSLMYTKDYPYDSRTTETGRQHWSNLAMETINLIEKPIHEILVLDIGSNTGALLSEYKKLGCKVIGVDPSEEASEIAKNHGIENFVGFFDEQAVEFMTKLDFKPNIVTSTNSFAHTDDLDKWLLNVSNTISSNGLLIIEAPHGLNLLIENQFDTIYHEHLSYVLVTPLINFFKKHGFTIFHVKKLEIHGGSIRIYATKKIIEVYDSVQEFVEEETRYGITKIESLVAFTGRVKNNRKEIREFFYSLSKSRQTIGIITAPAKGMTYFAYCGLVDFNFLGISDKNPLKIGKIAPGTQMHVITDQELVEMNPDYLLILAWNFKKEIMSNIRNLGYKKKFIVGIPSLEVIDA